MVNVDLFSKQKGWTPLSKMRKSRTSQKVELADFGLDKPLNSIDFHRWILYNRRPYELAVVKWPHTHGAIFWWDPTGALNCPGGATVAQSICNRQVRGSTPLWGSLQRLYPKKPRVVHSAGRAGFGIKSTCIMEGWVSG